MAAISPFNFASSFEANPPLPDLIRAVGPTTAFEDALAGILGGAEPETGEAPAAIAEEAPAPATPSRLAVAPAAAPPTTPDDADAELVGLVSPEQPSSEVRHCDDDETVTADDEEVADPTDPHACFVTWPWVPEAERSAPPPEVASRPPRVGPTVDTKEGSTRPQPASLGPREAPEEIETGRRTLRFPPPPAAAEVSSAFALLQPNLLPLRPSIEERAPAAKATREAVPVERVARRPLEPGFVAAPSFIEGGRVEWTLESPAAPSVTAPVNDRHRSMSNAIATVEHHERTLRAEAPPSRRGERVVAARRDLGEPSETDQRDTVPDATPPIERMEAPERSLPSVAEAPVFTAPARTTVPQTELGLVASEPRSAAPNNEASRARRQDDAELTVSQMTLSHRVEARTVVDHLGAITVRAETRDGAVTVSVAADQKDTVVFLDQNRADLTRDLRVSAPTVSDVSVQSGDSGSSRDRRQERPQPDWAAGTPSTMAAAVSDSPTISANGKRVRIVL